MAIDLAILNNYGLIGLLIVTFLSFTIIPFPYEAALVLATLAFNPIYVFIFALVGSLLGSITNYYLGYKGTDYILSRRESKYYKKADKFFDKYGEWSILLFNWVPLIGDPLIVLAGSFRMKFWKFLGYVLIGRIIYFILIIWFGENIHNLF